MTLQKTPLAAALAALIIGTPVFAQETPEDITEENPQLESTEVWGTKVRASSVFMSQEDIEMKQADHLSDLLRIIPGVDVGGAHSLNQRVTIRSMDDKDLNITIDGANQKTYMFHHMGNLQIHADILKAVDIDVGNNSVVNSGLGGAVRFETKTASELLAGDQQFGFRVKGTASDNGSDDVAASVYGELGADFDVLAYYNHVERSNYEVGGGEIKDQEGNVIPGTDGTVRGLEGTIDDALIKLGWDVAGNQRLELGYEHYIDQGDYSQRPDMGLATGSVIAENLEIPLLWPTEFSRDTLTLNYDASFGATDIKATVYQNNSNLWRDERGYGQNPNWAPWAGVIEGNADNTGVNVLANTDISAGLEQELTYGIEYVKYETLYQANYPNDSARSEEDSEVSSAFIQDRIEFNSIFALTPGVRYDSADVNSKTVTNKTYDDVTGSLALEVRPMDSLVIDLSSTQLFQAPELSEVFIGAGINDIENPNLKAETGLNTELAIAYAESFTGSDNFSAGATFFKTEVNDYIYDYAARSYKDNIGDMAIDGYELYTGYMFGGFDALLTYASAESKLSAFEAYDYLDGARLDRSQGDSVSFKLGYEFTDINLKLNWDFLVVDDLASVDPTGQLDGAGLENGKQGYKVHNIAANWQPVDGLNLTLGVDNLFDEYYTSQSSRTGVSVHPRFGVLYLNDYEPGRNIKATVSYQF